jgi:hypothetical protein
MIVTKVIPGFVAQRFDTKKNAWLDQEFIAGDGITYEDKQGDQILSDNVPASVEHAYLRLEMKQPGEMPNVPPQEPKRKKR